MSTKDWILLFVPILCNGVVVFVLQKIFEKRQLVLTEKYKYVSVIQQKVDNALALCVKALHTRGNEQINWLNQLARGYADVFYYYQQNQTLLRPLEKYMDELIKTNEQLRNIQSKANDVEHEQEVTPDASPLFYKIFELLQSIQKDCVAHKL